ncbi:Ubiquitin carboxyl-terminal hydrolase 32 [Phytophthora pseudosyringae]|uniref:Ubiquitin carboxyl-terminal hydrolase 32 n=1 Tax=Phytophthora pseudosyringae TaxID=221518 RepID=A0A8T1W116_9STRA|nr:Ubiquitin carboxyl-terminal hydrolase 32 [Phytophthora pseudosyringae]
MRGKPLVKPRPKRIANLVRQFTKTELHAASTAFHRARGHLQGLTIDRLQDALLHEVFVAIPELLVRRLFREWNVSGSGDLSLSEFLAGVATAAKGSRDDLLGVSFRMLSPSGDDKIVSRSDVSRFFDCVAARSRCIAIEKGKTITAARSWTTDELQRVLFGTSGAGTLTFDRFLAVLGSSGSFEALPCIDWIPNLATRVLRVNNAVLPTLATAQISSDFSFFTPQDGPSSKERDEICFELRRILLDLSADSTTLTPLAVIDKFRYVLVDCSLVDTIIGTWEENSVLDTTKTMAAREELKLFVLGLCCIHSSTVRQVYRFLFELFDEYSCGQIGAEQLSAFLQLTTGAGVIDSEREATSTIRRRGRSQSSLSSPPPSPGRSAIETIATPQVLNLSQFTEVAQEQHGFSATEVETALLLFHLERCSSHYQLFIINHGNKPLRQLLNNYFSQENAKSNAFCLLGANEWRQVIEEVSKCQPNVSKQTNAQVLYEEATDLPSGQVMIPLPVWLVLALWHGTNCTTPEPQNPAPYSGNWASSIQLGQNVMNAFWIRISVRLTSCDGFERTVVLPQVIVFEECTAQNVIDAVLFQNSWCGYGNDTRSKAGAISQCHVLVAQRNGAGEISTVTMQDDPTSLPQDEPLGTLLLSVCPSWALENIAVRGKLAFELQFSVLEVGKVQEAEGREPPNPELSLDAAKWGQQQLLQQLQRTVAEVPRGLANLGNTCFMNSVLQCLAATPMLKAHIIREHRTSIQPVKKLLPEILRDLFIEMSGLKRPDTDSSTGVSPTDLLKTFTALSPHLSDGNQQDAQEFLVCLLSHLSSAVKRDPNQSGDSMILSPRSHAWLATLFQRKDNGTHGNVSLQFCAEDSNGRHDRLVATEWWVAHLVSEPSFVNILFCGQFKSVLVCDRCTHESARFEPFSSLQLPFEENCTTDVPTTSDQHDLVVIVHFVESAKTATGTRGPVRMVVKMNDSSTVADVLAQLPITQTQFSSRRYIIGNPEQFTIQNLLVTDRVEDQLEDKTPASALPTPMHAFELLTLSSSGDDTANPTTDSTPLYLRFVHRQSFLVPFYCTTPTRQALCGSPFVCSSTMGALTGQALYHMVFQQFLFGRSAQSTRSSSADKTKPPTKTATHHYAPAFVLRRVRDDGIACCRCHWSTRCRGCQISPTATAAELLDLENCETLAIDWDLHLHPQDQTAFWWLQSHPTRDHSSYTHYRRTRVHPLQQSLRSLCSTEHLDASCSHCQRESSPHTKQLSLWSLPPILVLQLKRFELSAINGNNYQWKKLRHSVDFPVHDLDLRDFVAPIDGAHTDSQPCTDRCSVDALDPRVRRGVDFLQNELRFPLSSASRSCTKFDLYAVVNHSGHGIGSGHYTAQFRRPDESCWWGADDTVVTRVSHDDLAPSSTAYLLFYVRQDVAAGVTELSDLFPTVM